MTIKDEFDVVLEHGTNVKVRFEIETENFDTDYNALRKCLVEVRLFMKAFGLKTVAIPYKYGCGIANGDWEKVFKTED